MVSSCKGVASAYPSKVFPAFQSRRSKGISSASSRRIKETFHRLSQPVIQFFKTHKIARGAALIGKTVGATSSAAHSGAAKAFEIARDLVLDGGVSAAAVVRFLPLISIPIDLIAIGRLSHNIVHKKRDWKIDSGLEMGNKVGNLANNTLVLIKALHSVGAAPASALVCALPLGIVSVVFSTATIGLGIKGIVQSRRLEKRVQLIEKSPVDASPYTPLDRLKETLGSNQDYIFPKQMHMRADLFNKSLDDLKEGLQKASNEGTLSVEQVQRKVQDTVVKVRKRLRADWVGNILRVIASIVNIIGVAILLACPASPFGYAIVALGAALNLAKFIHDRVASARLEKYLKKTISELFPEGTKSKVPHKGRHLKALRLGRPSRAHRVSIPRLA